MLSVKEVVLCADDFGLTEGVSRGILDLARMGRLSATSVMTNGRWWPQLAPALRELDGEIGVGLHLTLTACAPLGAMPAFAPRGAFPPFRDVLRATLTGQVPAQEIGEEIARQLDRFESAFGRSPDFIDGHQHVHVLPGIRRASLQRLAARRFSGLWLRDPSDGLPAIARRRIAASKALVVHALATGFRDAARTVGFDTNEGFSGFSTFSPNESVEVLFRRSFQSLGPCPVVMCHPGHIDDELAQLDPVIEARPRELAYLASDRFADLLRTAGVTLIARPRSPDRASKAA